MVKHYGDRRYIEAAAKIKEKDLPIYVTLLMVIMSKGGQMVCQTRHVEDVSAPLSENTPATNQPASSSQLSMHECRNTTRGRSEEEEMTRAKAERALIFVGPITVLARVETILQGQTTKLRPLLKVMRTKAEDEEHACEMDCNAKWTATKIPKFKKKA